MKELMDWSPSSFHKVAWTVLHISTVQPPFFQSLQVWFLSLWGTHVSAGAEAAHGCRMNSLREQSMASWLLDSHLRRMRTGLPVVGGEDTAVKNVLVQAPLHPHRRLLPGGTMHPLFLDNKHAYVELLLFKYSLFFTLQIMVCLHIIPLLHTSKVFNFFSKKCISKIFNWWIIILCFMYLWDIMWYFDICLHCVMIKSS